MVCSTFLCDMRAITIFAGFAMCEDCHELASVDTPRDIIANAGDLAEFLYLHTDPTSYDLHFEDTPEVWSDWTHAIIQYLRETRGIDRGSTFGDFLERTHMIPADEAD